MPLTRRVQVFISQEASEALDILCEKGMSQKEAVERGLLELLSQNVSRSAHAVFRNFVQEKVEEATKIASQSATTKTDIPERLPARTAAEHGFTRLDAVGPTVESGRGKASTEVRQPLKRDKIVSIPKPGKTK